MNEGLRRGSPIPTETLASAGAHRGGASQEGEGARNGGHATRLYYPSVPLCYVQLFHLAVRLCFLPLRYIFGLCVATYVPAAAAEDAVCVRTKCAAPGQTGVPVSLDSESD
jgi:hypothetical protein